LQDNELFCKENKSDSRKKAGIEKVLFDLQKTHSTQRNKKITTSGGDKPRFLLHFEISGNFDINKIMC